ncbi:MAG TPA: prepilin-type N-terminal cleavage/methylation domain-containing protein [Gemmataceae bacterium]|jgi:prepilin-type N-terminal cleavage/methylation domain-containing protein
MYTTKKIVVRREAFTLTEMLVVIAIILAVAALAAAFAPRVNDNQKMSRAVDNLQQWLLTAKMRAKRDGLATGLRFIQTQGDMNIDPGLQLVPPVPTIFSQFQYIQQPDPLSGGVITAAGPVGGVIQSAAAGIVTFTPGTVDFTLGGNLLPNQWLVQPGDYLEINGGAVFIIGQVSPASPTNTLVLGIPSLPNPYVTPPTPTTYGSSLSLTATTNYRILRQPRILIGEEPLALPDNYAANFGPIPLSGSLLPGTNVSRGPSGLPEILFSPSGAVTGTNAGVPILCISVWDVPAQNELPDPNRVGIIGIQSRSGFMGAYDVSLSGNPFYFVQNARESGL